jgi:DNA polymerase-4
MAERVGSRLREHGLAGRTVTLKVRFPDFRTITRSATLPEAFDASAEIAGLALGLLEKVDTTAPVRLLGVTVSNLAQGAAHQGTLFGEGPASAPAGERDPSDTGIQTAVDAVRARFGDDAVGPAVLLEPGDRLRLGRRGTPYGPGRPAEEEPPSD